MMPQKYVSLNISLNFTFVNMFQCKDVIKVSLYADCNYQEKYQNILKAKANSKAATNIVFIHLLYLGVRVLFLFCYSNCIIKYLRYSHQPRLKLRESRKIQPYIDFQAITLWKISNKRICICFIPGSGLLCVHSEGSMGLCLHSVLLAIITCNNKDLKYLCRSLMWQTRLA